MSTHDESEDAPDSAPGSGAGGGALGALKYMLLCKVMLNLVSVFGLI